MAEELEIQIPWMRYDLTLPLIEGRVPIEGVKLVPNRLAPAGTVFGPDSPLTTGDFGLVDLNMANWLPAIEGDWGLVGLPVFSKRKHIYTYLFCRAGAGINSPKDLEGKRVLSTISGSAVAIWLKGLLQHRHGVDVESITWVSPREQWSLHNSRWKLERLERPKNVAEALLDGDVDATAVDVSDRRLFQILENNPKIKRLFPDYLLDAKRLYQETGIYPPVHMIVMSKKLDRQYPDLAGKLYAAFEAAKRLADEDILSDRAGFSVVDLRERVLEQSRKWADLYPHGIAANKTAIDTFASYCHEHGIVKATCTYERMFAASTLDT